MSRSTPNTSICHVAQNARGMWDRATPADPHHPVLKARGIRAHHLRQSSGNLLIPLMRDVELTPTNDDDPIGNLIIVTISGDESTVPFERRSRQPGQETHKAYPRVRHAAAVFSQPTAPCFGYLDGHEADYMGGTMAGASRVYLCTGWESAAKIHEATGCPAVGVMHADELEGLGKSLRHNLPTEVAVSVVATAHDVEHARDAAGVINARLVRADAELGVA